MSIEKNKQIRLITYTDNLFEEKKNNLIESNLEMNKDIYLYTNMDTNNKIEEEEQEETKENIIPSKKINKDKILNIEILTSSFMSKGETIHLTPEGYPQGIHYRKDGITYFGYTNPDNNTNNYNNVSIYIKNNFNFKYLVYDRLYYKTKR